MRFLPGLLLSLLTIFAAGCGGAPAGGAPGGPPGGARKSLVRVGAVTRESVEPSTAAVGTVVARRTSVVASGADGKVDQLLVREGDVVNEGQELSVLNMVTTNLEIAEAESLLQVREQEYQAAQTSRPEEIEESRARMEAAKVTRDVAADRIQRVLRLAQGGATNQDAVDEARERADSADKMFIAAQAAYELVAAGPRDEVKLQAKSQRDAQQQRVDFLKAEREKRTTRAPFRGIVVTEHTESGQWLSKNAEVVTIADLLEAVEIVANVDQSELNNVQVGANVTVTVQGVEPSEWVGCVTSVVPRSEWETGSRMFPVKVTVPNNVIEVDGRVQPVLREGMLARLRFSGPAHEATLVPKSSLVRSETSTRLYAVVPGDEAGTGKARPVIVQEAGAYGDKVEVLGEEVQPGMQVVTEGAERLTPFAEIIIQSDAPPGPPGAGAAPSGPPGAALPSSGAPKDAPQQPGEKGSGPPAANTPTANAPPANK